MRISAPPLKRVNIELKYQAGGCGWHTQIRLSKRTTREIEIRGENLRIHKTSQRNDQEFVPPSQAAIPGSWSSSLVCHSQQSCYSHVYLLLYPRNSIYLTNFSDFIINSMIKEVAEA